MYNACAEHQMYGRLRALFLARWVKESTIADIDLRQQEMQPNPSALLNASARLWQRRFSSMRVRGRLPSVELGRQ